MRWRYYVAGIAFIAAMVYYGHHGANLLLPLLAAVAVFIYCTIIGSFIKLIEYSPVLLIIAAFLPWVVSISFPQAGFYLIGMFLWGPFVGSIGPGGPAIITAGVGIPLILAIILLLAGGVLGFAVQRYPKLAITGGILGLTSIIIWLAWVGSSVGGWGLLFSVGPSGFSSISFGFFLAVIGSIGLIRPIFILRAKSRIDALAARRNVDGLIEALGDWNQ